LVSLLDGEDHKDFLRWEPEWGSESKYLERLNLKNFCGYVAIIILITWIRVWYGKMFHSQAIFSLACGSLKLIWSPAREISCHITPWRV
jgi:hypothetical protein